MDLDQQTRAWWASSTLTRLRSNGRKLLSLLGGFGPEIAWISAGQLVSIAGVAVGVRLVTGLLSPDGYGELALGLTAATLVSQVVLGPLGNAYERFFVLARTGDGVPEFLRATLRLTLGASGAVLAVGLALTIAVVVVAPQWSVLALGAIAFSLFSGWERILSGVQNAARQRAVVAWHQGLREWLKPVVAAAVLLTISASSSTALMAFALASAGVLASQVIFFRRTLRPDLGRPADPSRVAILDSRIMAYALPFATWGTFTWAQMSSDRWALQLFGDATSVGLYAIVYQLGAYPLTVLTGVVGQLIAPVLFAQVGEGKDPARIAYALRIDAALCVALLLLTLAAFGLTSVAHSAIFRLLVGPQYAVVSYLLPYSILASGIFNIGQLAAFAPLVIGDSRPLLIPTLGSAVLSVVMNFVAARFFGVPGVVVALLVFSLTYTLQVIFVAHRQFSQIASSAQAL